MSFVGMVYVGMYAELLEGEYTAYSEQVFLLDAVLPVAAIELVCDRSVEFAVHVEVRVHQIELHAAHIHTPDVRVDDAAGIRYFKNHGTAILFHHLLDRECRCSSRYRL